VTVILSIIAVAGLVWAGLRFRAQAEATSVAAAAKSLALKDKRAAANGELPEPDSRFGRTKSPQKAAFGRR
jgi:hypothetical protein